MALFTGLFVMGRALAIKFVSAARTGRSDWRGKLFVSLMEILLGGVVRMINRDSAHG